MKNEENFRKLCKADRLRSEKRYAEALRIFLELAESGDTSGMINAASMYSAGQGVEVDYDKVLTLEKRAAEAGDILAFGNLYHV